MAPARAILDKLKANEEGRRRIRMTRARGILDKLKANEQAKQNSDGSGPLHAPTWDLFALLQHTPTQSLQATRTK